MAPSQKKSNQEIIKECEQAKKDLKIDIADAKAKGASPATLRAMNQDWSNLVKAISACRTGKKTGCELPGSTTALEVMTDAEKAAMLAKRNDLS